MSEYKRSIVVSAKVTERESADLDRAAERDDRTVSDYIWLLVRRELYGRVAMMDAAEQTLTRSGRGTPLTLAERIAVFDAGHEKCAYCAKALTPFAFTVDHVVPLSRGGTNDPSNLVLACGSCNSRKRAKDADAFRDELAG